MYKKKESQDIEFIKSPNQHFADIGMAVNFIRSRCPIECFELESKAIATFLISEEDIEYLEACVRRTLTANDGRAGVASDDEWYKDFFEHSVRFGLNQMLKDENNPTMKYYFLKRGEQS